MKNQKYRKILTLFILIIFCAVIFAGCSSSGAGLNNFNKSDSVESEIFYGMAQAFDDYPDAEYEPAEAHAVDYDSKNMLEYGELSATSSGASLPLDRKIIRDANITMEVEDVEKSYENMLGVLTEYGGYEANRDMRVDYEGSPTVGATLKIPADKLDSFISEIKKEGKTISSGISSNDISDQYYDSKIRITTLEKTLENYYEFLENAEDVDEQLRVTRYINDITNEIEQLKGSIKRWDSLVDYSTVTLNLFRPYQAPEPVREIQWNSLSFDDMIWFISSGFLNVCNAVFSVIQWAIIAVATVSPVLIPMIILIILLIRHHKKSSKQYMQNKNINPAANSTKDNKDNNDGNKSGG